MRAVPALMLLLVASLIASPANAISVLSRSPNTEVFIGQPYANLEFENPLTGGETVLGHKVLEWRDADYSAAGPSFKDWQVSDPSLCGGNADEVWMLTGSVTMWTSTSVSCPILSIHLVGDGGSGQAKILVDGWEVAWLNMSVPEGGPVTALVLVKGLSSGGHLIEVDDLSNKVMVLGAAALKKKPQKWSQPPQDAKPANVYYGWNELSVREGNWIAADDWRCINTDPVTGFRWWGSFIGWKRGYPPPQLPDQFHITIWTDVPAGPGGFSHPGIVVWEAYSSDFTSEWVGWDFDPKSGTYESCFRFECNITDPQKWFRQPGDNAIYWVSIAAVYNQGADYQWGWKTRRRDPNSLAPDDAVRIFSPNPPAMDLEYESGEPIWWPYEQDSWDTAFELISQSGEPAESYIKWSQPPTPYNPPDAYNGWDHRSVYADLQYPIVADDWLCRSSLPVTDIHWWGSFIRWNDTFPPSVMPIAFRIAIWTDVSAGVDKPFSHPGRVIWEKYCDDFAWRFVGWDFDPRDPLAAPEATFLFEKELLDGEWFLQGPGTNIYWVSIAAVYSPGQTPDYPWGWKTRPRDPNSLAPDAAVRIFQPTAPVLNSTFGDGEPIQFPDGVPWDMAFALTTNQIEVGTLTFAYNHTIPDHFWWPPDPDPYNEMLSLTVSASPVEPILWETCSARSFGSGNDAADILLIEVWNDVDDDGVVTPGTDVLIGSGTYPSDDGTATITLAPAQVIPAGGSMNVVVSYQMSSSGSPGDSYEFEAIDASGVGMTYWLPVEIVTTPYLLESARKTRAIPPISIGEAKLLPINSLVFLKDKVVTADLQTSTQMAYMEEEDRSSGIGVMMPELVAMSVGERASVLGTTTLLAGSELVIMPIDGALSPGSPIDPVGMSNKQTGGRSFGSQPGLSDDGLAVPPAYSLSNVGMLIRAWGAVTGSASIPVPYGIGLPPYPLFTAFWINDGSNLHDGFLLATGEPTVGVAVLLPLDVPIPDGYRGITGIMRAIPNPGGVPVRLLVPRDFEDIADWSPPM